jgi:SAM-dependent methyltransferase
MLCGASSFQLIYQKDVWGYHRCLQCGLVALHPRPSQKELMRSYHAYLPVAEQEINAWSKMIEPVVNFSADLIQRRVKANHPRLLDIGCGYGFFLKKIQQLGWQVEGIEVSKPGRDYAGKKLGLKIHANPLEQLNFPDACFDAVTLFYVIEHVHDPKRMLAEVCRILSPEGILMLRWPHSTPVVKILGPFSKRYDVFHTPYHLYDFNPRTMHRLLQQAGFQGVKTMIGGHTLPQNRFYRWSSVVFGGLAEMMYRIARGSFLLPGVSKTTVAIKNPCATSKKQPAG